MSFRFLLFALLVQFAFLTGQAEAQEFPQPPTDFKDVTLKCELTGQLKQDGKQPIEMSPLTLIIALERKSAGINSKILVRAISATDGPSPPPPSITGGSPSKLFFQVGCSFGCTALVAEDVIMFTNAVNFSTMDTSMGTFSVNRYTGEYFGYHAEGPVVTVDKGKCIPHTIEKQF
jgi:hypothetical protein